MRRGQGNFYARMVMMRQLESSRVWDRCCLTGVCGCVCVCGKTSSVRRVVWPNNFSAFGERQSERQTSQRTCEVHDRLAGSSGNFIASSSCSVQRATCNVQPAPTCNGSCQVFLFVFHRPSRAAAIYLPSPRPGIARRPDAISVRSAAAPPPPPHGLLCCPLWCPARRSLCFFFYIITSTWAWAACPGHKFKFNAAGRLAEGGEGSVEGTA